MKNQEGFTVVEAIIILFVLLLVAAVGLIAWGSIGYKDKVTSDSITSEKMEKVRQEVVESVNETKTIPVRVFGEDRVSYSRKDNQTAELCATFGSYRGGKDDSFISPIESFKNIFSAKDTTHQVYRDDADFFKHSSGRNCYVISYAPINTAYEDKYKEDDKNWKVCDSLRQYYGKFTGQEIKGFEIGGPFTTSGDIFGNLILAGDVDAYDTNCVKIPVSDLDVGDKVELYVEDGPGELENKIFYVKAILLVP